MDYQENSWGKTCDAILNYFHHVKQKQNLPDPSGPIIANERLYQAPDCADTKLPQL